MTLGEKIKQARLEAGLSQRQLCGSEVTRNMLSQIENGTAKPSMERLAYFAARLGKPVSFFLEEDAVILPDLSLLDQARQALEEGKNAYAAQLLEQLEVPQTLWAESIRRQKLLLLAKAVPRRSQEICSQLPDLDEELMVRAMAALEAGDAGRGARLLDAAEDQSSPDWNFLRGKVFLARGDFAAASLCLHRAETCYGEKCAPLLEMCYRELGDFKRAYEYACMQR